MHFIAYCKHYAENTQNIPSKQASQPIIKQFTIWNRLAWNE